MPQIIEVKQGKTIWYCFFSNGHHQETDLSCNHKPFHAAHNWLTFASCNISWYHIFFHFLMQFCLLGLNLLGTGTRIRVANNKFQNGLLPQFYLFIYSPQILIFGRIHLGADLTYVWTLEKPTEFSFALMTCGWAEPTVTGTRIQAMVGHQLFFIFFYLIQDH